VLPGVVETPPDRECYGVMEVHEDRLSLRGVDTVANLTLPLLPKQAELPALLAHSAVVNV
jgi:hypothetical protein